MRTPTDADIRLCPDNVQEYIDRLTRENADLRQKLNTWIVWELWKEEEKKNADLRARLAAAKKARDEQAEAVRVLAAEVHSWWVAMDVDPDDEEEGETFNVWHNPTAAAAVKEAGGG